MASPKARIDDILETARARKVLMAAGSESANEELGQSPRKILMAAGSGSANEDLDQSPRTKALRSNGDNSGEMESSADEETSIMHRSTGRSMNYQGTQISRKGSRNKPSTSSIRRSGRVYEGAEEDVKEDEQEGWWARFLSDYGSIELENKGSAARDHLALERTFLAWLRTSLAFASIGIAITQLFRLNITSAAVGNQDPYKHLRQMGKPLGATFLGISIIMLLIGFHRYFESQHWIIRGKFPASRGSIVLVAVITFALMITSLVVVIVVEPTAFEKR